MDELGGNSKQTLYRLLKCSFKENQIHYFGIYCMYAEGGGWNCFNMIKGQEPLQLEIALLGGSMSI